MTERILPFDVRYALQYREAQLNRDDIASLANNKFGRLAFYVALRGFQDYHNIQAEVMSRTAQIGFRLDEVSQHELEPALDNMSGEKALIRGQKIAQISRIGTERWVKAFAVRSDELRGDIQRGGCAIIGHATFTGLDEFVRNMAGNVNDVTIPLLRPISFDGDDEFVGFNLKMSPDGDIAVDGLRRDFTRVEDTVVVDDFMRSGDTFAAVEEFWRSDGSESPRFVPIRQK
jgi:hypothetical protein